MKSFNVYRYEDVNGKDLIEEFILNATKPQKSKIIRLVDYLEKFGISGQNPTLKKLSGFPIWELRSLGRDNIRIFCAPYNYGIVLLHIIIKKTQKTSQRDITISVKRLNELLD